MKRLLWATVLAVITLLTTSCSKTDDYENAFDAKPEVAKLTLADIKANGEDIFDDDESIDVITSEDRYFYVNQPFSVKIKDGKVRIFNAAAHEFKNVSVWMEIPSIGETIKLFEIEAFPSLFVSMHELPLKNDVAVYLNKNGRPVETKNLALLSAGQIELSLECSDPIMDMFNSIKMKTRIEMGKYGGGNWGLMTANAARYYSTAAINLAVMFSSQQFADSVMNYSGSIHNDAGEEVDRQKLITTILDKERLNMGVVTGNGIAGLGGGAAFGLREDYLPDLFYHNRVVLNSDWSLHVWVHEFGHCIGYGHSSSMCYGAVPDEIVPHTYRDMMKKQQLPFVVNPFKAVNTNVPQDYINDYKFEL